MPSAREKQKSASAVSHDTNQTAFRNKATWKRLTFFCSIENQGSSKNVAFMVHNSDKVQKRAYLNWKIVDFFLFERGLSCWTLNPNNAGHWECTKMDNGHLSYIILLPLRLNLMVKKSLPCTVQDIAKKFKYLFISNTCWITLGILKPCCKILFNMLDFQERLLCNGHQEDDLHWIWQVKRRNSVKCRKKICKKFSNRGTEKQSRHTG